MRVLGCDVSHWEGVIDWETMYKSVGFCYMKATEGYSFVDDQFLNNKIACELYGVPHAPYHYFLPQLNPTEQAKHFVRTAGTNFRRYIADFEAPGCNSVNMKEFLDAVESESGKKPAIYTSPGFWNPINPRPTWAYQYELLVAHYTAARNPIVPTGWTDWKIWQFSEYFFFQGCDTPADADWFDGTIEECRNWFGNYHPFEPECPPSGGKMQMKVIVDKLNVRSGPGTSYPVTGYLVKGNVVDIDDVGGYNAWVKHKTGWSAKTTSGNKYMEVVS